MNEDELIEKVLKEYSQGIAKSKIAVNNRIGKKRVYQIINKALEEGTVQLTHYVRCDKKNDTVPKVRRTYKKQVNTFVTNDRVVKPKVPNYKEVHSTLSDGETVKCTMTISKKCVYGKSQAGEQKCRYSLVTGKCRSVGKGGCSWKACNKFSRISKDNPRLECAGE